MNLEYKYGGNAHLEAVFKRAVQHAKGKKIYLHMTKLYGAEVDVANKANTINVFENALKKYKYSKQVWIAYVVYFLNRRDAGESDASCIEAAKEIYARSLLSLAVHKHIFMLSQFGVALYACAGNVLANPNNEKVHVLTANYTAYVDEGRHQFEQCKLKYPKRTDIGNVYMDQETKILKLLQQLTAQTKSWTAIYTAHLGNLRVLYNKSLTSMNLNLNNVKLLFKKYLNMELQFGTAETQERVKEMAREYIANKKV